jgi:endonuclease YncB( thermonuclease family)
MRKWIVGAIAITVVAMVWGDPDSGSTATTSSASSSPSVATAEAAAQKAKDEAAAKAAAEKKAKAAAAKKAKAAAAKKAASGWTVTYVIDGDTVDVTKGGKRERIRVAGIDSPERGECGYGRVIRYLDVGKTDAGYRQIKDGYAIARYDSRDGYGWHTREDRYVSADKASGKAYTCSTPKPAPAQTAPASAAEPWNQPGPDLDCSDIGHPVVITGPDYHRLDRDGDGIGCDAS